MEIELDIAPGVHRVDEAYVNWYLVGDAGQLTVVDAGHPRSWRSLREALRIIGHAHGDIAAIVLTHGHFDHVGFAARLQRCCGIPVYAPAAEAELVAHPWRYEHERSRVLQAVRHPSFGRVFARMGVAGAPFVSGVQNITPYAPGDYLDVPGRPRAIATPGHTHGHCSLMLERRRVLIAGDAIVTFNPYTGGHGPQIVSGAATANSEQALDSLDAVAASGATVIATGHGPLWRGSPAEAVALARAAGPS